MTAEVQSFTGPLMIRSDKYPVPTPIHDTLHPPPIGCHAVPRSGDWSDLTGPVDFVASDALRTKLMARRGPKPKWEDVTVRAMRERYWVGGQTTVAMIAVMLGCSWQSAWNLLYGKTYWWA